MLICFTAIITYSLLPPFSTNSPGAKRYSASTSTEGPTSKIAGARMNTTQQVFQPPSCEARVGTKSSTSKLFSCTTDKL
ncbi:hypothetical protein M758_UG293600, partial [Ceratodon purpureus]